jgi:hypothetical protein
MPGAVLRWHTCQRGHSCMASSLWAASWLTARRAGCSLAV